MLRAVAQATLEQAGIVDALQIAFVTLLVDDRHPFRIGKENTDYGCAVLDVRAEIAERIGMATLNDRVGFRRERRHGAASSERERMRQVPASGTRNQSGRCASSYSIS